MAQEGIPRKARSGAISLPMDRVDDVSARATEAAWAAKDTPGHSSALPDFKPFTVDNPDGTQARIVRVTIQEGTKHRVTGGIRPYNRIGDGEIVLSIPAGFKASKAELSQQIRRVVVHEMAHAADPMTSKPGIEGARGAVYVNQAPEVTARIAEIADQLRTDRATGQLFIDPEMPSFSSDPLEWARASSVTFREIEPLLSPANKKKILRVIASAYDEARAKKQE